MANVQSGKGQTALITGASAGIGTELAECFARDGYDLIVVARTQGPLRAVAERLAGTYSIRAVAIAADLAATGGAKALIDDIQARGLSVDVLVNNAGYGIAGGFADGEASAQTGMVDLNIRALVELTHAFWPAMLARKHGGVLNVASTAAFQPGPFMAVYYSSKAFVLSFSEALWEEARGTGVHVTALCPGPTESKFHDRAGTRAVRLNRFAAMMAAKPVAEAGYRAFRRGQRVIIAGVQNTVLAKAVPFTPRPMVLGLVRFLQTR